MTSRKFIDLFAGCGGLSLGLMKAGWKGVFAVEKSKDAFETLNHNLCGTESQYRFSWPKWLPKNAITTAEILEKYGLELSKLRGEIDLIAGGPPCQGFSSAGQRNPNDPRNKLAEEYIRFVSIIQPKYLLLENVRGFQSKFPGHDKPYSEVVKASLADCADEGYRVYSTVINASDFGIPQPRARFIMLAVRGDQRELIADPFSKLSDHIEGFRYERGLNGHKITVSEAISDLEIRNQKLKASVDNERFNQLNYTGQRHLTPFQQLMRKGLEADYEPNSLRLPNHTQPVRERFKKILMDCEKGKSLSKADRKKFGLKKQCFTPLHPDKLAKTVTTLPDDMLHYSEPRILTVRENARLQSFPDWFEFQGKYTTGGQRRKHECPRYTQVGNAVPPLMAEAIGEVMMKLFER